MHKVILLPIVIYGVIPVVTPTVPKAENTSKNIAVVFSLTIISPLKLFASNDPITKNPSKTNEIPKNTKDIALTIIFVE